MSAQFSTIGFTDPQQRRRQRRSVVLAQLIATVALIVSIAAVVTAVSIGIARAGAPLEAASGGPRAPLTRDSAAVDGCGTGAWIALLAIRCSFDSNR